MSESPDLAYNLLLRGELQQVARAFAAAGLPFFVIKGVPLCLRLHGSLRARTMVDNDVVVHERDVDRAHALLRSLGFRDLGPSLGASRSANFQHVLTRAHAGGVESLLELHWHAASPIFFSNTERFWDHLEPFKAEGLDVPVLSREATLVHLATHWMQHGLAKQSILDDLRCCWELWATELNAPLAFELARSLGAEACLELALRAASTSARRSVDDAPLTQTWLVARVLGSDRLGGPDQPSHARSLAALLLLSPAAMARSLRWELFPPAARLHYIRGQKLNRWQLLRAYVERPLNALRRGRTKND